MRNQIEAASRLKLKALTINSTNTEDWNAVRHELLADRADLLLISPERLANDEFVTGVLQPIAARIGMLVVDEAHCISDWGHDFRPDYRRIGQVLERLPNNIAVLATTATANHRVERDVGAQLGDNVKVQRGPLMRNSLALQVMHMPSTADRLAWLAERIPALPGSGIVYVLTTRDAERVAAWLRQNGTDAYAYHADIDDVERERLEQALLANELKCLVATTALGMGYDKPGQSEHRDPGDSLATAGMGPGSLGVDPRAEDANEAFFGKAHSLDGLHLCSRNLEASCDVDWQVARVESGLQHCADERQLLGDRLPGIAALEQVVPICGDIGPHQLHRRLLHELVESACQSFELPDRAGGAVRIQSPPVPI